MKTSVPDPKVDSYDEFEKSSRGAVLGMIAGVSLVSIVASGLVYLALSNRENFDSRCPIDLGTRLAASDQDPMIWIGIDLPSNSPDDVSIISREVKAAAASVIEADPTLSRIKVSYDNGTEAAVVVDQCFTGIDSFSVQRDNEVNQVRAATALRESLGTVIEGTLASQTPSKTGGPLRLLSKARNETSSKDVVILWSDFLANDETCLDGDGLAATRDLAKQLVERCLSAEDLTFQPKSARLLGAGASNRSIGFEEFANDIAGQVCEEIVVCQ